MISELKGDENKSNDITRKDFLNVAAVGAVSTAMALTGIGLVKFHIPALLPDVPSLFKIGKPGDYPVGSEKIFLDKKVIIRHDSEGLYAISLVCTHLGCVVGLDGNKFACPCHGSRYDENGKVTQGPAPKALLWLKILQSPDGKLMVDAAKQVPIGTKFDIRS